MILAQGIADRLKERREKFKKELIEQGRAEGLAEARAKAIAEGEARGIARLAAKVADWNERRLASEARGEKFDEPPPMD